MSRTLRSPLLHVSTVLLGLGVGLWLLLRAPASAPHQSLQAFAPFQVLARHLQEPSGLARDPVSGALFVAEVETGVILRIWFDDQDHAHLHTYATGFRRPRGLAWDAQDGSLLVVDEKAGSLSRITQQGQVRVLRKDLEKPQGVAVGEDGTLYVTAEEGAGSKVPKHEEGVLLKMDRGGLYPQLLAKGLKRPGGLHVLQDGRIRFLADRLRSEHERDGGTVFEYTPGEEDLEVLVREGFKRPHDLSLDALAATYLTADWQRDGEDWRLEWGVIGKAFDEERVALFATGLREPRGLLFDPEGNLYVAEAEAGRILKFLAPQPPVLDPPTPAVTKEATLTLTGTTEPNAVLTVRGATLPLPPQDDVSAQVALRTSHASSSHRKGRHTQRVTLTNTGETPLAGALAIVLTHITPAEVTLANATGTTTEGDPYLEVPILGGLLRPGEHVQATLRFTGNHRHRVRFTPKIWDLRPTAVSDDKGHFALPVTLTPNTENHLDLFATAHYGLGLTSAATKVPVIHDDTPPAVAIAEPADGAILSTPSVTVRCTVEDATLAAVTVNGLPATIQNWAFQATVSLPTDGAHALTVVAEDKAGNRASATRTVVKDTTPPSLSVMSPTAGTTTQQATITATGTALDATLDRVTVNGILATITGTAYQATGVPLVLGQNTLTATATDRAGNTATAQVTVRRLAPGPPDPGQAAPPLDRTVATPLGPSTEFLYTGPNPIQTGVTPGAIQATRAAVLRGRVLSRDGAPLSGVTVSILSHSEYGTTMSRTDGMFDLAVNGGSQLIVRYDKAGYLSVQRPITPPWQDYAGLPEVVLIPFDAQVTAIDLSAPTPIQVARGNPVTDSDGTRRATLLFRQGTTADLVLPGGGTQPLTTLSVRATEYTVGPNGPSAMPAPLPPTSTYTYAVELSVDEAVTAGAQRVRFSSPVVQYTENFLNFPVGGVVPAGYYDRDQAAWVPADNGRVIKLLSVTGGLADLDLTGSVTPASPSALAALGITNAERQQLAALYAPGQSLWRMPIPHFSPWDFNWPSVPPADATAPSQTIAKAATPTSQSQCRTGSVIDCENQILRESLPLVGTPFRMHYSSDRVPGRKGSVLDVPVSGPTVPASLQRIVLEFHVGGRILTATLPAQPNQTYPFTWDGRDPYGRALAGEYPLTIRIGYVYLATFATPTTLGRAFGQSSLALLPGIRARVEITLWQEQRTRVGAGWDARAQAIGGWTLDGHHAYDHGSQTLLLGTGDRYSSRDVGQVINSLATGAFLGLTVDGQGNVVFTSGHQIKKRAPDGTVTLVAGTGVQGYNGDGGPAITARLNSPYGMDVDGQGNLFFADYGNFRIRKVSPDGSITTVAGNGSYGFSGDGGPATSAMLSVPWGVTVDGRGTLFIADTDNSRVRKVSPDGIITTVAGTGVQGFSGDGGPATAARLIWPAKVAIDPQGNLFIPDHVNNRIRKVTPEGIITTIAGTGPSGLGQGGFGGDGGPATGAQLNGPLAVALDATGTLYIPEYYNHRVRKLTPDGIITTVAGMGTAGFSGDGGPATAAQLNFPRAVAVDAAGKLYLADGNNGRIRKLTPAFPTFTDQALTLPSRDGTELYGFDAAGRHLRTVHALTGAVRTTFGYDPAGRLTTVTDGEGNVTQIERDGAGLPTAIVAPDGQRTTLTVDANGFLAAITNPAGAMTRLVSTAEGLLTTLTDPKQQSHTFTYDARGHLTRDEDPAQGVTVLGRTDSATSFTVTRTTALQRVETFQVDDLADGGTRRVTTDPSGLVTERLRTPAGIETLTAPDGTLTTLTERADPRFGLQAPLPGTLSVRTPSGLTSTLTTTRALTLSDPTSVFSFSTIADTVTLNGRAATSIYTAATKTITDTSPANRQVTSTLDSQGRVLTSQVIGLAPITFTYDPRGRLSTMTQGTGGTARTSTFTYNAQGFLASLKDPLARTVSFGYDAAGRVTSQTLPDLRVIQTTYDANGNVASITPPSRPVHAFTYTPVDLETSYTPPDLGIGNVATTYTYNADRQLTQVTRPDGQTLTLNYEPTGGRLSSLTASTGQTTFTHHPTTGNLATIASPGGVGMSYTYDGSLLTGSTWTGPVAGSVTRTYDADFRLATEFVNGANPITFQYDPDSLLTQAGSLSLTRNTQNGLVTGTTVGSVSDTRTYSTFGELSTYQATYSGSPLINTQYARDALGRISQRVETIGGVTATTSYSYDAAGRLTDVTVDGTLTAHYDYDGNGNRLSVTRPGIGTVSGTYDAQDRLTTYGAVTYSYTANGDLRTATSGGQTITHTYDVFGNLTAVALPSGSNLEYVIDGQNRRIGKKVDGVLVQGFLYRNQLAPVAELDGSGAVVARFVYGTRVNVPDYMIRDGVTYRIVTDHLGSPRLVMDTGTGTISQRLDYDEFGQILLDTNPGMQPFGFAGGIYDQHTKLTRFGARDYDAFTGRWTTKDPIRFEGGDTNLYGYVLNDPVNWVDPEGMQGPIKLGSNWTARVDSFSGSSGATHEIHVYNPRGQEVGVFGPAGWKSKHGFKGAPEIPREIYNRLNGVNVDLLRRQGVLPPKGQSNIKGGKYMRGLGCFGGLLSAIDIFDILQRAERSGKTPTQQYLEDMFGIPLGPGMI